MGGGVRVSGYGMRDTGCGMCDSLEPQSLCSPLPKSGVGKDQLLKDERIRVLWLIKGLGLGGAEMLFAMAAPHVDRSRFDYEVGYFLPWKDALVQDLENHGLPVTCFDIKRNISVAGLRRLVAHCRERRVDVIHMHSPIPGVFGRIAGRLARLPAIVYTEHNVWPRLNPISRLLNRLTFRLNDHAIAVSEDVRESIPTKLAQRVETIDNGIDFRAIQSRAAGWQTVRHELGVPDDCLAVVNVANLTPKKNHELLLDAFAQLHKTAPNSQLVLVGQFADRKAVLREYAARLGLENAVLMTGPRTDVPRIVKAMDVFALSSTFEGLPIALLEAMALGKPVVCTSVGGIPRVICDSQDGFLVPSGDADLLAERLERLALDPRLREKLGAAACARVRSQFDISVMVQRVEQVYRDILRKKGFAV